MEKKSPEVDPRSHEQERRGESLAFHEAGHAAMIFELGGAVTKISINEDSTYGVVHQGWWNRFSGLGGDREIGNVETNSIFDAIKVISAGCVASTLHGLAVDLCEEFDRHQIVNVVLGSLCPSPSEPSSDFLKVLALADSIDAKTGYFETWKPNKATLQQANQLIRKVIYPEIQASIDIFKREHVWRGITALAHDLLVHRELTAVLALRAYRRGGILQ